MASEPFDWTVTGGETKNIRLSWATQVGEDVNGDPIMEPYDLSDCTALMQFRRAAGEEVAAELSSDLDGGLVLQPVEDGEEALGVILIEVDPVQTFEMYQDGLRRVRYDLFVEFPDGTVKQVIYGQATIRRPITVLDEP